MYALLSKDHSLIQDKNSADEHDSLLSTILMRQEEVSP